MIILLKILDINLLTSYIKIEIIEEFFFCLISLYSFPIDVGSHYEYLQKYGSDWIMIDP